jgi:hypothetical protein
MSDNDRLKKIEDALARIERGLFGEKDNDHWGLVLRVANHSKRLRRLEIWAASLVTAGGVVALIYKVGTDWLAR